MKSPKDIKWTQGQYSEGVLLRLLFRHGGKMIAGIAVVLAVWLALHTRHYTSLSWQPKDLTDLATDAETLIKESTFTAVGENVKIFDYASHAQQIRSHIPSQPYSSVAEWSPVIYPEVPPRGGVEVLTAESLWGEAVRLSLANTENPVRWHRPPLPGGQTTDKNAPIWVNVYGTIPLEVQWSIYNQTFETIPEANRPQYVYYELERAELKSKEELVWQPVVVYPDYPGDALQRDRQVDLHFDLSPECLIPFDKQRETQESYSGSSLLYSDVDVQPAQSYAYRIRLYLLNPNYNLQESAVEEGVDTKSEFIRSDWSTGAIVYVPDRTLVRLQSVLLPDPMAADFPRQTVSLRAPRGTLLLEYFDMELGQALPAVEKRNVERGMLGNLSRRDANRFINQGRTGEEVINVNYPESGLRSDVCVMDFSGGRRLQRRSGSPDLSLAARALLLIPDGTMQIISTEPELFR